MTDFRSLVPACAMKAERLLFESDIELLIALVRGEDALRAAPDFRIASVLRIAYERPRGRISVKGISAEFGRSPDHVAKLFRRYTGIGISRYLSALRIRAAYCMLRKPVATVEEIAAWLGYSSAANFDRWFQSEFEMSPVEFREQVSNC